MKAPLAPFVREETCSCGATLRIEDRFDSPREDRFIAWRREHICTKREDG